MPCLGSGLPDPQPSLGHSPGLPCVCARDYYRVALYSELEFQAFLPSPSTPVERLMALNCPVRALRCYLQRSRLMCKSSCLFVGFSKSRFGREASQSMLSGWLQDLCDLLPAGLRLRFCRG
jgi:hypothetical protein